MCSSYSGPSCTGIQAFFKDRVGKGKLTPGTGITTAGGSGPSAASIAGPSSYIRRKSAAPALDNIFGVSNG